MPATEGLRPARRPAVSRRSGAGPDPADARPAARHRRRSRPPLVVVFAITVTGILSNTLINAPLPDIVADLGVPDERVGLLVASGTLSGIVMAPIIGLLADRYGRRPVLVPCLLLFGVAGLAGAAAPTFEALLVARLLQGFGSAGLINLAVVLIADSWDGTQRAKVIGQNAAVLTVGLALLPAVGGGLAQIGGWRWAFAPFGIALVTAVAVWAYVPDRVVLDPPTLGGQIRAAAAVVRQPVVAASVAFGGVLFVLIFGLFLTTLPLLLEDRFGLDAGQRGLVLAAPALGSATVALLLGRLRRRFGARRLLRVATALFAVAFLTVGLAPALLVLLGGALLYGLGEGSAIPTVQDLVAGAAPDESRGAVVAVWVGSARLGQTVGPLLAGVLLGVGDPELVFVAGAAVAGALLVAQLVIPSARFVAPAAIGAASKVAP